MTRKHLTGLLLAACTMTLGTIAVVHAQDGKTKTEAHAAEAAHDHEHTPTTIHTADGKVFELTDEEAYPDADGFKSMQERVSYAIGRNDGTQIPNSQPDLDEKIYAEGVRKGLAEANEAYALGYAQGFELGRRFLAQQEDDFDVDAFIQGLTVAAKEKDSSKSIGYLVGNGYREAELDIVADPYLEGVGEAMAIKKAADAAGEGEEAPAVNQRLSDERVKETLEAFRAYVETKQREEAIAEGQGYIDALKAEDGWKKTESGIAYKVIEAGEGESPDENDVCTMHYEGSLIDGTVFDSSYQRGKTLAFAGNQVIKGWGEMLQLMKPGAIFEVVIPYDLGYGERGSPPNIPPYAALKFKMEMKSFQAMPNPEDVPDPTE